MARTDRLFALMQILRRHRAPVAGQALADELGVSLRSVYRDIQAIRDLGATVEGEAGVGYVLRPGFVLPPLMFADDEIEAVVLGLRLAAARGDPALGKAAEDALAKVRAVLPLDLRRQADDSGLWAAPQPGRDPTAIDVAQVRRAIRAATKVRLRYVDERGRESERVLWPLALTFFERVRLVLGWCEVRQDFRSFRVDRIVEWVGSGDPFDRPRRVLIAEWKRREGVSLPLVED